MLPTALQSEVDDVIAEASREMTSAEVVRAAVIAAEAETLNGS